MFSRLAPPDLPDPSAGGWRHALHRAVGVAVAFATLDDRATELERASARALAGGRSPRRPTHEGASPSLPPRRAAPPSPPPRRAGPGLPPRRPAPPTPPPRRARPSSPPTRRPGPTSLRRRTRIASRCVRPRGPGARAPPLRGPRPVPRRSALVMPRHNARRAAQWAARGDVQTGGVLLSRALAGQVPSALRGLTALFGMGRGVSPSPWPPETGERSHLLGALQNRTAPHGYHNKKTVKPSDH